MKTKLNDFDRAVLHAMLADPDTAETAAEWVALYPDDRDRAETEFAVALVEDLRELYCTPCERSLNLSTALVELALLRTNFRRVARAILDRFFPAIPAGGRLGVRLLLPSAN